jgi:hypothetical protein
MKILFFLILAVVASIFFPVFAVDSQSEVLLREPLLLEVEDGETVELMFTGVIIFPADNKENVICLCEAGNQGYYAKLTPKTIVYISGKIITKHLKEKLKSLNGASASMYGVLQEKIIFINSDSRTYRIYEYYWKEISIAPLNPQSK